MDEILNTTDIDEILNSKKLLKVFNFINDGLSYKEIGDEMGISKQASESFFKNIKKILLLNSPQLKNICISTSNFIDVSTLTKKSWIKIVAKIIGTERKDLKIVYNQFLVKRDLLGLAIGSIPSSIILLKKSLPVPIKDVAMTHNLTTDELILINKHIYKYKIVFIRNKIVSINSGLAQFFDNASKMWTGSFKDLFDEREKSLSLNKYYKDKGIESFSEFNKKIVFLSNSNRFNGYIIKNGTCELKKYVSNTSELSSEHVNLIVSNSVILVEQLFTYGVSTEYIKDKLGDLVAGIEVEDLRKILLASLKFCTGRFNVIMLCSQKNDGLKIKSSQSIVEDIVHDANKSLHATDIIDLAYSKYGRFISKETLNFLISTSKFVFIEPTLDKKKGKASYIYKVIS